MAPTKEAANAVTIKKERISPAKTAAAASGSNQGCRIHYAFLLSKVGFFFFTTNTNCHLFADMITLFQGVHVLRTNPVRPLLSHSHEQRRVMVTLLTPAKKSKDGSSHGFRICHSAALGDWEHHTRGIASRGAI